ncbi:MAG: GAF domain-containing protein [Chloroflexota bacterium]
MTQSIPPKEPLAQAMPINKTFHRVTNFLRSSIRNRLTAILAGSALIPVLVISIVLAIAVYTQVRNALTQEAYNKLAAVQTIKSNQVTAYLAERRGDMTALSETISTELKEARAKMDAISALKHDQIVGLFQTWDADVRDVASDPGVVAGMRDLASSLQEIGASQARTLYLGQGDLEIAQDGSPYSSAHFEQHGFFKGYTAIHGYEDAFLIDPNGNVVYSVHKTDVFGANLLTGSYAESNLTKLYLRLLTIQSGESGLADVALFEGENAMFIGAPIYDGSTFVGMLVYRLPLNKITTIMAERTGLGDTADTFLIAREDDGRITYRSNRTIVGGGEYVVGYDLSSIATQFMHDALDGKSGGGIFIGSVGDVVINSYRSLEIEGLTWAVLARVTAAEAFSPLHKGDASDFLTQYKETYGYYDIFLIEPNGFIFYTVVHEPDYRTNILNGPYKDTNLGSLITQVMAGKSFGFVDFASYAPSAGAPAAFFAIPVLDENDEIELIVATQASQAQISEIMAESTGLGESGETFIIGQDQLYRTDTRFLADLGVETTILNPDFKVNNVASRSVLIGESGQGTYTDDRGVSIMAVWSPITIGESGTSESTRWGVIAKMDVTEALAPLNRLVRAIGLLVGLGVLATGALAAIMSSRFAFGFVRPILTLTDTAAKVAAGDMNLTVQVETEDEIGTLSNAFNTMTSEIRELVSGLEERVAARTKDLATVAEVGTATATILESNRLLQAVVDLTKERFNLYHSHIYLLDEAGENLVLAAGAGEPGRIMASEKRSIPLSREQSLVARSARERKGVAINDVTQTPDFLPNPLLPNTRSELAVPMIVGGKLIGVFDVQSDQVGRFTESDIDIQNTLAVQVATSIQNVRSFEQAKAQAEFETLVNTIGQKIQRASTMEEALQTAIREIGTALGAARVKVRVGGNIHQDGAEGISRN